DPAGKVFELDELAVVVASDPVEEREVLGSEDDPPQRPHAALTGPLLGGRPLRIERDPLKAVSGKQIQGAVCERSGCQLAVDDREVIAVESLSLRRLVGVDTAADAPA